MPTSLWEYSGALYVNVAAITTVMNVIILNESGDERIVTHHSRGDLHAAPISGSAPKMGCVRWGGGCTHWTPLAAVIHTGQHKPPS